MAQLGINEIKNELNKLKNQNAVITFLSKIENNIYFDQAKKFALKINNLSTCTQIIDKYDIDKTELYIIIDKAIAQGQIHILYRYYKPTNTGDVVYYLNQALDNDDINIFEFLLSNNRFEIELDKKIITKSINYIKLYSKYTENIYRYNYVNLIKLTYNIGSKEVKKFLINEHYKQLAASVITCEMFSDLNNENRRKLLESVSSNRFYKIDINLGCYLLENKLININEVSIRTFNDLQLQFCIAKNNLYRNINLNGHYNLACFHTLLILWRRDKTLKYIDPDIMYYYWFTPELLKKANDDVQSLIGFIMDFIDIRAIVIDSIPNDSQNV
jgi:hypothetical protein